MCMPRTLSRKKLQKFLILYPLCASNGLRTFVFTNEDNCPQMWRQLASSYQSLDNIQWLILLYKRWRQFFALPLYIKKYHSLIQSCLQPIVLTLSSKARIIVLKRVWKIFFHLWIKINIHIGLKTIVLTGAGKCLHHWGQTT